MLEAETLVEMEMGIALLGEALCSVMAMAREVLRAAGSVLRLSPRCPTPEPLSTLEGGVLLSDARVERWATSSEPVEARDEAGVLNGARGGPDRSRFGRRFMGAASVGNGTVRRGQNGGRSAGGHSGSGPGQRGRRSLVDGKANNRFTAVGGGTWVLVGSRFRLAPRLVAPSLGLQATS